MKLPASFGKGKTQALTSNACLWLKSVKKAIIRVRTEQERLREMNDHQDFVTAGPFAKQISYSCSPLDQMNATNEEPTLYHLDEFDEDLYADPLKFSKFVNRAYSFVGWSAAIDEKCSRLKEYLDMHDIKILKFSIKDNLQTANVERI